MNNKKTNARRVKMGKVYAMVFFVMLLLADVVDSLACGDKCVAIYVDVKEHMLFKASTRCDRDAFSQGGAGELCRESANDPKDCVSGQMTSEGCGDENASRCRNRYIAITCAMKNGRPYCSIGCGDSQSDADAQALDTCRNTHTYQTCRLQDVD